MSTSNIPIYYDGHLVGSITLAEFMNQPRYAGESVMTLMSLRKKDLIGYYMAVVPSPFGAAKRTKSDLIYNILGAYWRLQGQVDWEKAAISEVAQVYLFK